MSRAQKRPNLSEPVSKHLSHAETTVRADQTIAEALAELRRRPIEQHITYFYVVDGDNRLLGVVSTRRLLLEDPQTRIRDVMEKAVVSLPAGMTLEDALEFFAMHRLLAFPVVDRENKLLGMIDVQLYAEEVFDLAQAHRMADLYQFVGISVEQARQPSPVAGFRMRMPWLMCNMAGGVACAIIAAIFRETLVAVIILAMFIPLVLTLSESISMQAMTLSLQFLHRPGVVWKAVGGRLHMEWRTAALLGGASGLVVAVATLFWGAGPMAAAVIGASILASMIASAIAGLSVPVGLHLFRLDPRIASGPVVLMLADVVTTAVYLGLATWMLV
jgi:magnesium transporter